MIMHNHELVQVKITFYKSTLDASSRSIRFEESVCKFQSMEAIHDVRNRCLYYFCNPFTVINHDFIHNLT